MGPGGLGDLVCAAKVNVHDREPQLVGHIGECLVAQDTGVVDDDVDAAEGVNDSLDDLVTLLGRSLDADSLAAGLLDLVDNIIGVDQVVDSNGSTSLGESVSIRTADTSTSASDKDDLALEVRVLALLARTKLHRLLEETKEVVGTIGVSRVGEVGDLVPLLENCAGSV